MTATEIELTWRETVPRIRKGSRDRGFGTEVIERMVGGTLDATIERTLHSDGMEYGFVIPLNKVRPSASAEL